jgi:hypothetical protein
MPSLFPHVSQFLNNRPINLMDNHLPQGKMEAAPLHHGHTTALFLQLHSGGQFLSPNDEFSTHFTEEACSRYIIVTFLVSRRNRKVKVFLFVYLFTVSFQYSFGAIARR